MHTWYRAVCDTHKEMCHVLVTSTFHLVSDSYLADRSIFIREWLDKHYGCSLRLVKRDDELDPLWETYTRVDKDL